MALNGSAPMVPLLIYVQPNYRISICRAIYKSSSAKWQADLWPGAISRRAGVSCLQMSRAMLEERPANLDRRRQQHLGQRRGEGGPQHEGDEADERGQGAAHGGVSRSKAALS